MTNKKYTKRALLTSILCLILCFSMLIGTTMAWFTDEVSSVNNVITAGNLDVEVTTGDGKNIQSQKVLFDEIELWEPGVVAYENLTVANVGSLALTYKMSLNFTNENEVTGTGHKLSEILKVAVVDEKVTATNRDVLVQSVPESDWALLKDLDEVGKLYPADNDDGLASTKDYGIIIWWEPSDEDNNWNLNNGKTTSDGRDALYIDLGIQLHATQLQYEEDSFGDDYDGHLQDPDADVDKLEKQKIWVTGGMNNTANAYEMELDTMFRFRTTETYEQAQQSEYRYWHADFVVKADKDVAPNSIALAGYYEAYCKDHNNDYWVALKDDRTIPAGTEIRLLQTMLNGGSMNYEELCNWVPEFLCGAADMDGSNAGTTLTVELRMYETTADPNSTSGNKNIETGEYVTIGTYSHTFGTKVYNASNAEQLKAALSTGNPAEVNLAAGTYDAAVLSGVKDVTISGTKDTIITTDPEGTATYYGLNGADVAFEGVTIQGNTSGQYNGYAHAGKMTYENCTIDGTLTVYSDSVFKNCTFNLPKGCYIWAAWGPSEVTFENCTFNTAGKAILVYHENGTCTVNVKGCTFNATAGDKAGAISNQNCAAIEIDNSGKGVGTGTACKFTVNTENNTVSENFSGEWRIKTYDTAGSVTVNGTAYTSLALDGKPMTIVGTEVTVN